MVYEQLIDFLQNRMRMSHVYQPVMLMALLRRGGRCSTTDFARCILARANVAANRYEASAKQLSPMEGKLPLRFVSKQKRAGEVAE